METWFEKEKITMMNKLVFLEDEELVKSILVAQKYQFASDASPYENFGRGILMVNIESLCNLIHDLWEQGLFPIFNKRGEFIIPLLPSGLLKPIMIEPILEILREEGLGRVSPFAVLEGAAMVSDRKVSWRDLPREVDSNSAIVAEVLRERLGG